MKVTFLLTALLLSVINTFAQKQTYDVVSYSIPQGWQKQQVEGGVQLFITDAKTGGYAIAIITKAMASTGSAEGDFNSQWKSLLVNTVTSITTPTMIDPVKDNGWEILSGNGNYVDGNVKGLATLITATGNQQTTAVVLMTNTQQYQNSLLAFINSLELKKIEQTETNTANATPSSGNSASSIVGLWCNYRTESSGTMNGMPMLTAGYFRREYFFYADGTYLYRVKDWSVYVKDILFVYETGKWTVSGNTLTITPDKGRGEWWSKAPSGRTTEWGSLQKSSTWKLETVKYTFDLHYYSGSRETHLLLKSASETGREGTQENNTASYAPRANDQSLIDYPPGFKTGLENKSTPKAQPVRTGALPSRTGNATLTGTLWEGTTSEKFAGGHYTGGFFTSQYKFNADGTYRFVDVLVSHYTETKTLKYESGRWSSNGNQLTISPASGLNEEWTKTGKTSNGNSDVTNRAINSTWGKKLKSTTRKLEQYTYTFSIGKNGNVTALIMQRNGRTEREGEGRIAYFNETNPESSVVLPNGFGG